jgi:hypothetical protein
MYGEFLFEQIEKSWDCVVLYQNNSVHLQSRIKKAGIVLKSAEKNTTRNVSRKGRFGDC